MADWSYKQAIDWLNSRTNYEKKWPTYGRLKFHLLRMERLARLLGNPHLTRSCIHVTGTKGKGSTVAMVASVLRAAGMNVGTYTSPHLVDIEERIRVNDENIPKERLASILQRTSEAVERIRGVSPPPHPTFFEIFTAVAFCFFEEENVDWAIYEVGLGGRLDCTNIIHPEVTAVTRVGLDHTGILGHTVGEIAYEKAGIFKQDVPAISAEQEDRAARAIRGIASSVNAELWEVGRQIECVDVAPREGTPGMQFGVKTPFAAHPHLEIPLVGEHQAENAAVAVGIVDALRNAGKLNVTDEAIGEGLAKARVPGRIEVMGTSPLVVVDGAHNPMAMQALVDAVTSNFTWRRLVLLLAMASDKDIESSLDILLPHADEAFFTVTNSPRATKPEALRQLALVRDMQNVHCETNQAAAFRAALDATTPDDLLLITGSFYLVGDLRAVILESVKADG